MKSKINIPPFEFNERINNYLYLIGETIGSIKYVNDLSRYPRLAKANRLKSVRSSIAIENNILSLDEVTDVINNKKVIAPADQIAEAKNCFNAYNCLDQIDCYSLKDLLKVHSLMVRGLTDQAGMIRNCNVGVYSGNIPVHIAPKPEMVYGLLSNLFEWVKTTKTNFIVASCVFHYEFEFIHPFVDGNGRMGRLWQTALLAKQMPLFKYLPIEEVIFNHRPEYYKTLRYCQYDGKSTKFIEFMCRMILIALNKMKQDISSYQKEDYANLDRILEVVGSYPLSSKQIMKKMGLKNQPSFFYNYLKPAIEAKVIRMTIPDKPKSKNQKYYK